MNNPEQIQMLTSSDSREESERNRQALEQAANADRIRKVTVSQKRYWLTVIVLLAIIVALVVVVLAVLLLGSGSGKGKKMEVCTSKECFGLTSMMKSYQNESVDPCEDFFEHSCGRLYEHVRDGSSFGFVQYEKLLRQVYHVVENTEKFESKPNEQLRIFVKKCMDRSGMDSDNFENLKEDIERRGGFPMIDEGWDEAKFDLSEMLANYIRTNRNRLPFLAVEPFSTIENNKSVNYLFISPGPHHTYHIAMPVASYKEATAEMIRRLLKLENRKLNEVEFGKEYQKLVYLEGNFSKLADYSDIGYESDSISRMKNLTELVEIIPEIDWVKILRAMPREGGVDVEKALFSHIQVHGGGDYFFGKKRELARLATETPNKVLANYIVVRQLIDVALYFYNKDQPKAAKYYNHDSQSSFCATQLAYFFPMPAMNVFIRKSGYNLENLKIVSGMFDSIKKEYLNIFNKNQYLEPEVRAFLLRKLDRIGGTFANEQYLEGTPLLEKMYRTLYFLETDSPYQIYMKLWRHRTEQLVDHIVENTPLNPVNLKQFALNAAYQPYQNSFYINIAYLTFPWMDSSFPAYSNYGYIGHVIGHEIGHAFDYFHRRIDENGKLETHWFTKTNYSNTEYGKREKCLRDQYSVYKEPGYDFFMNGTFSRYEIAGDHMGIRTSYRAFKKVEDTVVLPGFEGYSVDQMFFLNYALRNCDIPRKTTPKLTMLGRHHPTNRFRVNGVLQNVPEFSEAFQCSKDAPMNAKEKCELY